LNRRRRTGDGLNLTIETGSGPLAAAYRLVTGEEPSARVRTSLRDFAPYATGTILAKVLSVGTQLYLARALGPAEFGKFSLAIAITLIVSTPIYDAWGATFIKFNAIRPGTSKPWHLLRAVTILAVLSAATLLGLALVATAPATSWLNIPRRVYFVGLATAVAAVVWFLAKATCQGMLAWNRLVSIDLSWAVLILTASVVLSVGWGPLDWKVILVFAAAYLLSSLPALPYWLKQPQEPVAAQVPRLWNFGKYLGGAALVLPLLTYGDRFLVNAMAGTRTLGIYQAYALPSLGVAMFAAGLVNRFLFPLFNLGDPAAFRRLFRQSLPWASAVFVPAVFAVDLLSLELLRYPLHLGVVALASLAALAYCAMSFLTYLVATDERRGPRVVLICHLVACSVFFPVTLLLLPLSPLAAPFVGYTLAFLAAAAVAYRETARFPLRT
jgi:O-antigen/teichoic acid export membrane protein